MNGTQKLDRAIRQGMLLLGGLVLATSISSSASGQESSKPETEMAPAKPDKQDPQPAIGGYCPVAYILHGKAMKGDPAYQSKLVGEVYYFSSKEAKDKFDFLPQKYLPQFGGLCTTALGGTYGNRLQPDPEVFKIVNGKLHLFWSERARRAYETAPDRYLVVAAERFAEPALGGACPVSYLNSNAAVRGLPRYQVIYKGWVYHLASDEARDAFRLNPSRYTPQYGGFCAEGVSRNKRYSADPEQFVVREGKTYLFFDAKAKLEFRSRPAATIELADKHWATLKDKPRS